MGTYKYSAEFRADAAGLPLLVGVSAAGVHDSKTPTPMVLAHLTGHASLGGRYLKPQRLPVCLSACLPACLPADKAYDVPELRKRVRGKRIGVRIARKGIESGERLRRRRRVIERTMSWLTGCRRLNHRYEHDPLNHLVFPGPSAALRCHKRLLELTTQDTVLTFGTHGSSTTT